jgi:nucleoside-diphosphate-sugar epimerase
MKIAIIGSNSFLAKYIIRELSRHNIGPTLYGTVSSREFPLLKYMPFKFPNQPINYSDLLGYDAVIYTAGAGIQANLKETPEMIYELNSFIPIRLATVLSTNNFKGKLITFGSYFEIGSEINERYYSENEVVASLKSVPNHYCVSKRILSRFFFNLQNLNFYHLILPNIYGKGENSQRLIPYLIRALTNNEQLKLTNGEQVRQYIHASDVANAIFDITCENYPKGIYNLCRREAIQIKELVKRIFDVFDQKAKLNALMLGSDTRKDTEMPYLLLDNTKALYTFKYQPEISIEEGIKTYLK